MEYFPNLGATISNNDLDATQSLFVRSR